ncbi:MAG: hypothetical protein Greene041614_1124 [Parcubacteria group bacterium Greene0416_14]|nr:MAG: hypothetical protein Greene041614_1124 [Parcubacteria group bacterium Greene0416_14]
MNTWITISLMVYLAVAVLAIAVGSNWLEYTTTTATILICGLSTFAFCFWEGLGVIMNTNARG